METATEGQKLEFKNFENKPTALVAGGAGFLGSYLCEALIAQGFNVLCVDNLARSSKKNIEKLLSFPNFFFWEEDINRAGFTISPNVKITHIFHLASVEEYLSSNNLSLETLLVNSIGTKNLLDVAVQKKAKFIFVSSSEVFRGAFSQKNLSIYFGKEAGTTHLTFGEAKRFSETLAAEYFNKFDLPVVIVRIKDPYGPKMNLSSDNIVSKSISQAIKGKIEIIGDGLRVANPTFVTDIIFGIVKAAIKGEKGEIFNLISRERCTERALAEHLKKLFGGVEVVYKEQKELDLPESPLILDDAQGKLNWDPKVPLDDGLVQTVNFYKVGGTENKEEKNVPSNPIVPPVELTGKKGFDKNFLRNLFLGAILVLFLWATAVPIITSAASYYLGNKNFNSALEELKQDKTDNAVAHAEKAENFYKRSQESLQNISWLLTATNLKGTLQQTSNYLFLAETLSRAVNFESKSIGNINDASSADGEKLKEDLKKAIENITEADKNIDVASTISIDARKLPAFLNKDYQTLQEKRQTLESLSETINSNLESTQ
ncbi:MAG: hypothetical protein A2172_00875 [Candidatus Woykebacteria bacterium RBG_13_40_15]|uniref:NAD-dependent epimerase/dehydratase domain-containing protein n=1 Tax=Candidatus Woykebacteria bacterium RBG_13_40_15 TaxID=1802593 RepID=A0A1G1W8U4_9BACT|nr:MAG: hypothetical protein A2172_00875 [Candidatus Woykebacteria bacterium RBG_13_40_15]